MKFIDAMKLCAQGNDIRHPGMHKGIVIQAFSSSDRSVKLTSFNPFNNERHDYTPTEDDQNRTDWIAGQGIAAL
jgi:hypothetical protein